MDLLRREIFTGGFFFMFVEIIRYGMLYVQRIFQTFHFMLLMREANFINSILINDLEGVTQRVVVACCLTTIRHLQANNEQQLQLEVDNERQQLILERELRIIHTYNVLQINLSNMERDEVKRILQKFMNLRFTTASKICFKKNKNLWLPADEIKNYMPCYMYKEVHLEDWNDEGYIYYNNILVDIMYLLILLLNLYVLLC
ncbi:9859_t:CDS:2 [Funneliformis caledonium]|uniref:9859_t:CDS:1 n=1 Tax=Funneliformis caledonium TaxID=1117310 RepID=A0A9N9B4C4_9GLOM|nr:9859_t:CDS:2 [Funneliformis caledonium]